jgi:NAD(P)-dependent dehydrogenase (short-subunit alcohol dehydrogenase family)
MNVSKAVLITGCSSGIGWATTERLVDGSDGEDPYAGFDEAVARATDNYERRPFSALGGGPETVAEAIAHAVSARNPSSRYCITPSAHLFMRHRRLLPDRVWDAVSRTICPQPRR